MNKLCLIVLDGWGNAPANKGNAIITAHPKHFNDYWRNNPHTLLDASGEAVGLPAGFIGNSEVGHLHIGAGRLIRQDMVRINHSIEDKSFFRNKALVHAFDHARKHTLHIMGLLSDGGVHSHINHLFALLDLAKKKNIQNLYVHAFLDGRDVPPNSAAKYLSKLEKELKRRNKYWRISSILGRYYAMDRDNRWNREHKAYDSLVNCNGFHYRTWREALNAAYKRGETDEFVQPSILGGYVCAIKDHDSVIFYNFRSDRARELTRAFVDGRFNKFRRRHMKKLHFVCLTQYDHKINAPVAFPPEELKDTLGEVLSKNKIKQFRLAETEKWAHVTFFFNGLSGKIFPKEDRLLIPSPKVTTYDKSPAMSASKISRKSREVFSKEYGFVLINFANADMVGHTGKLDKVVSAIKSLDNALYSTVEAARKQGFLVVITADHGNAEQMLYPDGTVCTAHTTNKVPFIIIGADATRLKQGALYNIAPTVLELMRLKKPKVMDKSLTYP